MCQLTMVDFNPEYNIVKTLIRSLNELNTLGINAPGNHDGFGYVLFEDTSKIENSVDDARKWWVKNYNDYLKKTQNGNGIYHVRLASTGIKTIREVDAHPFKHGNIILAHNGTLHTSHTEDDYEEIEKLYTKDMIDSEMFTVALAHMVGDDSLTPDDIKAAYKYFYGVFALLIHDTTNPNFVWIAKGTVKTLNCAEFYIGKKRIGILFNTGKWETLYWSSLVKMYMANVFGKKVSVEIKEIEDDKIWKYTIGSYKLDDPVASILERNYNTIVHHNHSYDVSDNVGALWPRNSDNNNNNNRNTVTKLVTNNVAKLAIELNLSVKEVWILSELAFDRNIFTFTMKEMEDFYEIMQLIKSAGFKGRIKEWINFRREHKLHQMAVYHNSDLEFPYLLNSKKNIHRAIKVAANAVEEKDGK